MPRLTAIVLGSAAGGGVPQWNCGCAVCRLAWAGDKRVKARTQTSLAVSANNKDWILLNASPDLRPQIASTGCLQPKTPGKRTSPISAVVLTGAEIDQIGGLLHMREGHPFTIFGTKTTLGILEKNSVFKALSPAIVSREAISAGKAVRLPGKIEVELFFVPGKVPLYLENGNLETARESENNMGVEVRANGVRLVFIPGAARLTERILRRLSRADVFFFDATLFRDDEMIRTKTGRKTGRRMGHMPIDGKDGSLAALSKLVRKKIYIHINNTNPILIEGSPERKRVEAAGFKVAEDGMEIVL